MQERKIYLDNVSNWRTLVVELALCNDVLKVLKRACLALEGNGALVFKVGH